MARRQGVGAKLRLTGSGDYLWQAACVRVCRWRIRSTGRRPDVHRSGHGRVDFGFPFRSRSYESVNASCPVVFDRKVFISASYRTGGALLEIRPDFTHRVVWTTQEFALHFNTAIYKDGYLYGFDRRNKADASLACVNVVDGKVVWREIPEWTETFLLGSEKRQELMGTHRGSLFVRRWPVSMPR